MNNACEPVIQIDSLETGYGKKQVLNGISLDLAQNEIVALIGHNGAGKSTLLKAVFGLLPIWKGDITFEGSSLCSLTTRDLRRIGVAFVPQGNRVFRDLTVRENLEIGGTILERVRDIHTETARVLELFPVLKPFLRRKAQTLSGGEKQMLALATALISAPRVLLLDEPSLGLASPLVVEVFRHIHHVRNEYNAAVLIAEQKVREVLKLAERVCVLKQGRVTFFGHSNSLDDAELRHAYL